ncbi:MAG: 50S ribosomal protein L17 [Pirellulales bacterium]|nr:50S ribosomal protein L17 [Pirellulales bacterium]
MRHRRRGRKLGRNPNHQRALLRNLASALFLTEREVQDWEDNKPKTPGRIVTTLHKAKEVRPLVEKCITIARDALPHQEAADRLTSGAERHSEAWRAWRESPQWREWNRAVAPVITARRRVLRLLGNKQAMQILFSDVAPRFAERNGGYTRVLHLAQPRLGDAGARAILELVGQRDRVKKKAVRPVFDTDEPAPAAAQAPEAPAAPSAAETPDEE